MNVELGTLVEIKRTIDAKNEEKMAIVKIDQGKQIVILEHQETGEKIEMTFDYFSEITGIQMDKRKNLHG